MIRDDEHIITVHPIECHRGSGGDLRHQYGHDGDVLVVTTDEQQRLKLHLFPGVTQIDQEVGNSLYTKPEGLEIDVTTCRFKRKFFDVALNVRKRPGVD